MQPNPSFETKGPFFPRFIFEIVFIAVCLTMQDAGELTSAAILYGSNYLPVWLKNDD
jgi:hypothetical protein